MRYDVLRRLNIACSCDMHYFADGLNLDELYWRSEEVDSAEREFNAALQAVSNAAAENEALRDAVFALDAAGGAMCSAHDEQGFCNGFSIAMRMFMEAQQTNTAAEKE